MGKQGRRKQRQKRNQRRQQVQHDPIHNNNTTPVMNNDGSTTLVASTSIANPHSAVQQLRNPDPKVRHAALVALQASVLSQLTSSSRPINIDVLQAVREQVTNNDLECSAVAADCLAQYLSATADNTNNSKNKDVTASWSVVLIGRLHDCYQALATASQEEEGATKVHLSKNQQKKRDKVKKQWYAVAAPCLIALCQLIEDNAGNALDRINTEKKTFLAFIFGLLSLQCVETTTKTTTSSTGGGNNDDEMMTDSAASATTTDTQQQLMSDKIANELRVTTALYAARCLHSALDENRELAEVVQQGNTYNYTIFKTLLESSNEIHPLSMTTRLHLLGSIVNLYQLSLSSLSYDYRSKEEQQSSSWEEELLHEYGINTDTSSLSSSSGLLWKALFLESDQKNDWRQQQRKHQLENFRASREFTTLERNYRNAQDLLDKQEQDQQLEDEIDAKVRERKEPAKDIAKRQKKEKEHYKNQQQQQQNQEMMTTESEAKIATTVTVTATAIGDDTEVDDIDMMDVAPPPQQQRHSGKIIREQNGEEAVNDALGKWNEQMGQVQLALEIVTNLLSTWVTTNNSNDEDDDMNNSNDNESNTLRDVIGKHQTCSKLMILLQTLTSFVRKGTKQKQKNNNVVPYEQNDVIKLDIDTTISKIAACMMNCLLCENVVIMDDTTTVATHTNTNTSSLAVVEELWSDILYKELLQFCVHDDNRDTNIIRNGNDMIVESLLSILVVLTKVYPDLIIYHTRKCGMIVQRKKIMNVFHNIIMTTQSRDAICLLSSFVHMEATKVAATQFVPTSVTIQDEENTCISFLEMENIVRDTTKSFTSLLLLPSAATAAVATTTTHDNNNNNHHKIEILKTFMDWYGNDTFYPHLYNELDVSDAITSCLQSIATSMAAFSNNDDSNSSMDMEEEEMMILSNSERFVEYKKQLLLQQQQQQQK